MSKWIKSFKDVATRLAPFLAHNLNWPAIVEDDGDDW